MREIINKKHKKYMIIDASRFCDIGGIVVKDIDDDLSLVLTGYFDGTTFGVANLFDKYEIPKEYRKIIINLISKEKFYTKCINGEEVLTKIPFIIERENDGYGITYRGIQKSYKYGLVGCAFYNHSDYSGKVECANANLYDIVKFYRDLRDNGLLKKYVSCLMELMSLVRFDCNYLYNDEIFDKNFNLDYAIDIMTKKKCIQK